MSAINRINRHTEMSRTAKMCAKSFAFGSIVANLVYYGVPYYITPRKISNADLTAFKLLLAYSV